MLNKKLCTKLAVASYCSLALGAFCEVAYADAQNMQRQLDAQQRSMISQQSNIDMLQSEIASLRGELEQMRYQMSREGAVQPAQPTQQSVSPVANQNTAVPVATSNYQPAPVATQNYQNNTGVYAQPAAHGAQTSATVSRGMNNLPNSITLSSSPKDNPSAFTNSNTVNTTQMAGPVTPMGNANLQANQQPLPSNPSANNTAPQNTTTTTTTTATNNSGVGLQPVDDVARQAYNNAYALVQQNNLKGAEQAFAQYVQTYPENALTPNAWYWLGQVQYAQKNYEQSRLSFLNVARFVDSQKRPDALYKLGMITKYLGDNAKAQRYFQLVLEYYPTDAAASLAQNELNQLAQ